MGNGVSYIVPLHEGDYPEAEAKSEEILEWFLSRDMVAREPSACLLSLDELGYRYKPPIAGIIDESARNFLSFTPHQAVFGMEVNAGARCIFHEMEGAELQRSCPNCGQVQDMDTIDDFMMNWLEAINDYPLCDHCKQPAHITTYKIDDGYWGYSNLGVTFWNLPQMFNTGFLDDMRRLLEVDDLRVIHAHL